MRFVGARVGIEVGVDGIDPDVDGAVGAPQPASRAAIRRKIHKCLKEWGERRRPAGVCGLRFMGILLPGLLMRQAQDISFPVYQVDFSALVQPERADRGRGLEQESILPGAVRLMQQAPDIA